MERLLLKGEHGTRNTMFLNNLYGVPSFTLPTSSPGKSKDLLMQLANLQLVEDIVDGDFISVVFMKSSRQERSVMPKQFSYLLFVLCFMPARTFRAFLLVPGSGGNVLPKEAPLL